MNCNEYTEKISAYIDGMLDSNEMQSVKKHIDSCDECAVKYKAMSSLSAVSASLSDIKVPDCLMENVLNNLDKPVVQPKIKNFVLPAWVTDWRTYSSVAACILAVFLVRTGIDKKYNSLYEESLDYAYVSKLPADDVHNTEIETDNTSEEIEQPSPDVTSDSPVSADIEATANNVNSRSLTSSAETDENVSAAPATASSVDSPAVFMTPDTAETEQSSAAYSGGARSGGGSGGGSSASSSGTASAKTTPVLSELDREKDAILSKYTFTEKGSMVKRRVIFTIPSEQDEVKAAELFSANASKGESAVASALNSAGINYKKNEIIAMDYTSSYNALARSGNSLKEQVSSATSTTEVNTLDNKLSSVESQLTAISKTCSTVELALR